MDVLIEELARQHLRLVRSRDGFVGSACPFHKGGQERRPSFWINKADGSWGCFSCNEHGRDLKSLLTRLGVRSTRADALLKEMEHELAQDKEAKDLIKEKKSRQSFEGQHQLPESLLGVFDWCPVILLEAGFSKQTLRQHDIGFDKTRGKITFPIRDVYGHLIGISGRCTDGTEPKYKVYTGRKLDETGKLISEGELGGYFPSYSSDDIKNHLWRGDKVFHRLYHGPCPQEDLYLIVVEGYKAALWLVQLGWSNTVALMGRSMSNSQERLIRMMGVPTWILLDNNEPGITGSYKVSSRLASSTFPVYRCNYPPECDESVQPDNLTAEQLEQTFARATRIGARYESEYQRGSSSNFSDGPRKTEARRW